MNNKLSKKLSKNKSKNKQKRTKKFKNKPDFHINPPHMIKIKN